MDQVRNQALRLALGLSFFVVLLGLSVIFAKLMLIRWVIPSDAMGDIPRVVMVGIGGLVLMVIFDTLRSAALRSLSRYLNDSLGERILREQFRDRAMGEPQSYSQQAMTDLKNLRQFITTPTAIALLDALFIPMLLLIVFLISWIMGVIAAVFMLIMLATKWATRKPKPEDVQASQNDRSRAKILAEESIRYAQTVQAMGMRPHLLKRWQLLQYGVIRAQSMAHEKTGTDSAITSALSWIMLVLLMAIGVMLIFAGQLDPSMMIIIVLLASRLIMPMQMLANGWPQYLEARDAYQRLKTYFEPLDRAKTSQEPLTLPAPKGTLKADKLIYRVGDALLLKGISFNLKPGQVMGLVGPSGSGKTTLARILTGTLRPQAGLLRLDAADMHQWDQEQLGQYIGYLPQDVELFPGTVSDNIARFQVPNLEQVRQAARRAGVDELIEQLPAGYNTRLEEGASNLPGGLRQRIALARALYTDPVVLILDEPDAYLDTAGVDALQTLLQQAPGRGMTVILATHKVPLLRYTQALLLLKQGEVVQFGATEQIINKLLPPTTPSAPESKRLATAVQT